MFPWISWSMFLSANARPGNGGPLMQPRGQTSVFYTVPPPRDAPLDTVGREQEGAAAEGGSAAAAGAAEAGPGGEAQREVVGVQHD